MTMKRTGNAWMPADEYGRRLPQFTVNLLVRDLAKSLSFYTAVLGATVRYQDADFAAMVLNDVEFMLHADHTYDQHPLHARLQGNVKRGSGAELRMMGIDPDAVAARAKSAGATILQPVGDFPHGWRDVIVEDVDGYIWAVGMPLTK
ncbi:MAG: VOC family protein [Acidobacteriota bacterium]|nr:VOC family protein [Acidobacteriota bacterium]